MVKNDWNNQIFFIVQMARQQRLDLTSGRVNISQFLVSGCWIQIQWFQIPIGRTGKAIQYFIQDFVILFKQVLTCLKPWISTGQFGEKLHVFPRMMPMQIAHQTVPIARPKM
jgi:hypothetical protein